MSVSTTWGYTITDADALIDMLSISEYNDFTAFKYADDVRVTGNIKAACSAIRNYCGWHVYPSQACEATMRMNDRRVTRVGRDLMIQLPAKYVSAVSSVTINGVSHTAFSFEPNGILMVYDVDFVELYRYTPIVVTYTAGIPDMLMDGIKELVAHRVTHAAASSNGITTEAAGGISVTYNANWVNSARATALPDDNKEVLAPYRLQGVF